MEIGLVTKSNKEHFYILKPHCFGERNFDKTQQTLIWQIIDKNNNSLVLKLLHNELNEKGIKLIEAF